MVHSLGMESVNKVTNLALQRRVGMLTLIVGSLVLGIKFWAYQITGSQAVFSDALESIINVITALTLLMTLIIASKPADEDHPYGHGKVEYFSAAFEGGLISFAAVLIFIEAGRALFQGKTLSHLTQGQNIILVATVLNLLMGLYLRWLGKKKKSLALQASGQHLLSDVWTSVAVIAALFFVGFTGQTWIDPVFAILAAIYLAWSGIDLLLKSTSGLMDAEDEGVLEHVRDLFMKNIVPGIIRIHYTRVMRSGSYHHIDSHVVVPEFWDVKKAHDFTDDFERSFLSDYEFDGEIHFHVDPCHKAYCRVCDLQNCPIRQEPFQERIPFTLEELKSPLEPEEFLEARREN